MVAYLWSYGTTKQDTPQLTRLKDRFGFCRAADNIPGLRKILKGLHAGLITPWTLYAALELVLALAVLKELEVELVVMVPATEGEQESTVVVVSSFVTVVETNLTWR